MKQMISRVLSAILVILSIALVGCGNSESFVFTDVSTVPTASALSFQTIPQRTAGTNFNTINVGVVDQSGNVITTATNPVTLSLVDPGGATLSGTTTRNAVDGVASFNDLSVDIAGDYAFLATSPGLTDAQSVSFDITAASPATITITQQPGDSMTGMAITPELQATVFDDFGNPVPGAIVDISLVNDPSGTATLSGTTQATTDADGSVAFTGLSVDNAVGTGFTLQVTADTVSATSSAFDLSDRLYVANFNTDSITVHDFAADGNTAPLRTISGGNTGIGDPVGLALNGNELFCVGHNGRITVYPRNSDGNVSPLRTIEGGNTGLGNTALHMIVFNDELYVAHQSSGILVFPVNGNGNIFPTRTLSGGNTGLTDCQGVAIAGNELYASNNGIESSIRVFNVTDNGDVSPLRVISGGQTQLNDPTGLFIQGDELFVGSQNGDSVSVFRITDQGDVPPQRVIVGGATGLNVVYGNAVSAGLLFATSYVNNSLRIFGQNDDGDVAPMRVIFGGLSGIDGPLDVVVGSD